MEKAKKNELTSDIQNLLKEVDELLKKQTSGGKFYSCT